MEENRLKLNVKEWYRGEYPTDDLVEEIKDTVTFEDIFEALDNYRDIYNEIGTTDSLVRERIFNRLATLMEVDYDYIYDQWLKS